MTATAPAVRPVPAPPARPVRGEPVTIPAAQARAAAGHARELGLDLPAYVAEAVAEKLLRDGRSA